MVVNRKWLLLLCLLAIGSALHAQDVWVDDAVEGVDDGTLSTNQLRELEELYSNPININDTLSIGRLPFVDAFQLKALRFYIALHGELLSLDELYFVPGWDSATIAHISPMAVAERIPYRPSLRRLIEQGRHTLHVGMAGTWEQAEGYRNGYYEGDNLRALLLYRFRSKNRIDLRIVADKDPTEAWGKDNYRAFHLMLTDMGVVEQLVVGRYCLHYGQGLTLWSGYSPYSTIGQSTYRHGAGIKPAPTFAEEDCQQGIAASLRLPWQLRTSLFASGVEDEHLVGTHLDYETDYVHLGTTLCHTWWADSLPTSTLPYRQYDLVGKHITNLGVEATAQYGHLQAWMEMAMGFDTMAPAAVGGLRLLADASNYVGLGYRYRSAYFHSPMGNPFELYSRGAERGFSLDAKAQLPLSLDLAVSIVNAYSPTLSYANYGPSTVWWIRLQLHRRLGYWGECSLRYNAKLQSRNYPQAPLLYEEEATARRTAYATLRAKVNAWRFCATLSAVQNDYTRTANTLGYMATLEARHTTKHWTGLTRLYLYHTADYASRLYAIESGLPYMGSLSALYGRGMRLMAVAKYSPIRQLQIAAQYILTYRFDVESLGSSHNRIDAPHRQQWALCLRWQL